MACDDIGLDIEGWQKSVRRLQSELDETIETKPHYRGVYDLVGIYYHRKRIERLLKGQMSSVVVEADELLKSFSDLYGTSWVDATGLAEGRGDGWWWEYIPSRGPLRGEIREMIESSRQRGNIHPEL